MGEIRFTHPDASRFGSVSARGTLAQGWPRWLINGIPGQARGPRCVSRSRYPAATDRARNARTILPMNARLTDCPVPAPCHDKGRRKAKALGSGGYSPRRHTGCDGAKREEEKVDVCYVRAPVRTAANRFPHADAPKPSAHGCRSSGRSASSGCEPCFRTHSRTARSWATVGRRRPAS